MDIMEERRGKVVLLTVKGRLDSITSPALEEKLLALLSGNVRQFVLNFSALEYISSNGLRVLLMAVKKLRPVDGVLALLTAQAPGVLHTGSLMLVPPENAKVMQVIEGARALGWTISIDVNLRPRVADDLAGYCAAVMQAVELADWVKASDEDLEILGFGPASLATADELRQRFARGANRRGQPAVVTACCHTASGSTSNSFPAIVSRWADGLTLNQRTRPSSTLASGPESPELKASTR